MFGKGSMPLQLQLDFINRSVEEIRQSWEGERHHRSILDRSVVQFHLSPTHGIGQGQV